MRAIPLPDAAPPDRGGRNRRVIEYDPIGTGYSTSGNGAVKAVAAVATPATSVADAADELLAVLEVMDLGKGAPFHLVAHGSGCATALEVLP